MRKWLNRGVFAFVVAFGVFIVYVVCAAYYWQVVVGHKLEQDLGFRHGTPYVLEGDSQWPQEVLTVESIVPGGVFDKAGFRIGDVLLRLSINGLFQQLEEGRGQEVEIQVVDGGDGPPLDERPVRTLLVVIP